jgi:hypothetical protein
MHHSHAQILADLDPHNPLSIQALIDFHRETFGGWKMEGDDGEPEQSGGNPEGGKPDGEQTGDKPLGPNGEKALQAERDARKAAETKAQQAAADQQSLMQRLAEALGVKDKDAKSTTDDIVATLQAQMATLTRNNLVLEVANENQITDKDDLGLLRDFTGNEDGLRKLAARLKPSSTDTGNNGGTNGRRPPTPDQSQGRGAGADGARPSSVAQVMADRRAAREAKSK